MIKIGRDKNSKVTSSPRNERRHSRVKKTFQPSVIRAFTWHNEVARQILRNNYYPFENVTTMAARIDRIFISIFFDTSRAFEKLGPIKKKT